MKKKILSGIFALALPITAGYGVSKSMNDNANADLSLLALSNVEALAFEQWGPDPEPGTYCDLDCYGGGYCWAIRWTWNLLCERTGNPYHFCRC